MALQRTRTASQRFCSVTVRYIPNTGRWKLPAGVSRSWKATVRLPRSRKPKGRLRQDRYSWNRTPPAKARTVMMTNTASPTATESALMEKKSIPRANRSFPPAFQERSRERLAQTSMASIPPWLWAHRAIRTPAAVSTISPHQNNAGETRPQNKTSPRSAAPMVISKSIPPKTAERDGGKSPAVPFCFQCYRLFAFSSSCLYFFLARR